MGQIGDIVHTQLAKVSDWHTVSTVLGCRRRPGNGRGLLLARLRETHSREGG